MIFETRLSVYNNPLPYYKINVRNKLAQKSALFCTADFYKDVVRGKIHEKYMNSQHKPVYFYQFGQTLVWEELF